MNISQVVVFTQCPEFKMLLDIECRNSGGFTPVIRDNYDEFLSIITLVDKIDIIIIDEPQDKSLFQALIKLTKEKLTQFKQVYALTNEPFPVRDAKVFEKKKIEDLMNEFKLLFMPSEIQDEGYISIPISSLLHFKILPFDLFVKIGEGKFIKRIPAHEEIDKKTFSGFLQKGMTDLFFEKKFKRDFSTTLINSMINQIEREFESIDEKLEAADHVYQTTHSD